MIKRGGFARFTWGESVRYSRIHILCIITLFSMIPLAIGDLGPENLLILVNADSTTSRYIAQMYREYYPAITDVQVLELNGLPDCSGPTSTAADEIITRDMYNSQIAEPVRQHLLNYDLLDEVMVIVTTGGMPYRIEDTVYGDVIYPAGSNYNRVSQNTAQIDAASVESELTCLWYADEFGIQNRMVNPYQGYRNSSITLFERAEPGTKSMSWTTAVTSVEVAPKMEGDILFTWPPSYGTVNRHFNAGDIYLTCRLDGPKRTGKSAVFSVRQMLERSKRASSASCGINASESVVVIDDCPAVTYDLNRVFNLDGSVNYYLYNPGTRQPPDAPTVLSMDDFSSTFDSMTSGVSVESGVLNSGLFDAAYDLEVLLDLRAGQRTTQNDLGDGKVPIFLCCFGKNGDEACSSDYLTNGLDGQALFNLSNGAVFTSVESFNALTMFSDEQTVPVAQGKIVDFITIGGSGAVGHAFEPMSSSAVDNNFFAYNLLADSDMDNRADLTFVEAAFTGIPFLSWAEVVIGDPLMRITYGPGEEQAWDHFAGDASGDGIVNSYDIYLIKRNMNGALLSSDPEVQEKYKDMCDVSKDLIVNSYDLFLAKRNFGNIR